MNIGIDIDGTITTPYYWLNYFNKLFNKNVTEKECIDYNLRNIFGYDISDEEWNTKCSATLSDFLDSVDTREDMINAIQKLKEYHKCYFITARNNREYNKQRTEEYLAENSLSDIELHMLNSHNKVTKAKELNIDVFLEDCGENAIMLANEGIKVLLIDTNYNQGFEHENIIRVYNGENVLLYFGLNN